MQNNYLKIKNISISLFLSTAILTVLRTLLLFFGFSFETSFFKNDIQAYLLYIAFLLVIAVTGLMCRSVKLEYSTPKNFMSDATHSLSAIFFISAFILYIVKLADYSKNLPYSSNLIRAVCYTLCICSAFLSALYYVLRLFSKKEKSFIVAATGACPSIFFASFLIEKFATVSASAASLSHFADIISILVLAFFILKDSRNLIPNSETPKTSPFRFFVTFIALSFSAIPDLITIIAKINSFNVEATLLLVLKVIFMIFSLSEIFFFSKASREDNK